MIALNHRNRAYFSDSAGHGNGAVLLFHAWWGLTPFFRELCDRIADQGFVVLCPDLYRGRSATTVERAKELVESDQAEDRLKLALLGLHHLKATGLPLSTVGFSMGGDYALWAATEDHAVERVVAFYGGTEQDQEFPSQIEAAVQGHFAIDDEWEPLEGAQKLEAALRAAGRSVEFFYYDAGHWFFESDQDAHAPDAAETAWKRTVAFLRGSSHAPPS
jgi:carboxymethylenebutenolidase